MSGRSVRSIIRRRRLGPKLISARPDETAREAAKRMAENCCGSVLVMEDDRMLGIFTERDLLARVVAAGRNPAQAKVREVMTTDIQTIEAGEPVEEAIRRMDEGGFRHLPVVEGERVLGIVSARDIPILELGRMAEELHERHRLAERIW
jgi:CBS domain-containing protein